MRCSLLRGVVVGALAVLGPATFAGAAQAHPFGDPQTVEISGEGSTVRIRWSAAGDDLTALALHLQVLAEQRSFVFQDGALVPEESDPADAIVLAQAPKFAGYLLERIVVRGGGGDCTGEVTSTEDLVEAGAALTFTCPGPVRSAQVTVTTLTDIHPAYRTLASAGSGDRQVYTAGSTVYDWRLAGGDGGSARSAALQLSVVGGAVLLVVVAGALVWRRRRSRAR